MPNTDKTILLPQLQRYDQKIKGWADNKFLTKVDIPSLPKATATTLGGVKVGYGLSVTDDGILSAEDDIVFTWDFDTSAFSCNKTFAEVKKIITTGVRRTATANGLLENFSITLLAGAANDDGVMFFGTAPTNTLGSGMLGSKTYGTTTYLFQNGLAIMYMPDGQIQMTEELSDLITNMSFDFKNTTFQYDQYNSFDLKDGGITSAKLADGAVTAAKLASGAVTADKIANGAITADKLASGVGGGGGSIFSNGNLTGGTLLSSVSFDCGAFIMYLVSLLGGDTTKAEVYYKVDNKKLVISPKSTEVRHYVIGTSSYQKPSSVLTWFQPKSASAKAALATLLPVQDECEQMEAEVAKLEQDWIDNQDETVAVDGNGVPITLATKKTELEKKQAELEKLREDYFSKLGDWKNEVQE